MQFPRKMWIAQLAMCGAMCLGGCGGFSKSTPVTKPAPAEPTTRVASVPVAAVWYEMGYPPPGVPLSEMRRLIVGVWSDGQVVWSDNRSMGGGPYHVGQVEPQRVEELIRAIDATGFFAEKRQANYGPDASHTILAARAGDRSQRIGSWHEPASTRPGLVIDERGMYVLEPGQVRPAPSTQYATFLREWAKTRELIEGEVPAHGEVLKTLDPSVFDLGR